MEFTNERIIFMKILLILMIFVLVLTLLPINTFAFSQLELKDIDMHWAEDSIELLNSMEVMNGYEGFSNPDVNISRAEFTALIARSFDLTATKTTKNFKDITKDHMFYNEINAASSIGLINGFEDDTFRPTNYITREEIMLIVSRLTESTGSGSVSFNDISRNYKYINELSKITDDGIIGGYPDKTFKPYNKTTRAEAAKIIVNAVKKYMPNANADDVYSFGNTYIYSHFSNPSNAFINAIGAAKKDLYYINRTYDKAKNLGYNLINEVNNVNILSFEQYGPFTILDAEYTVNRSINGSVKNYKGKSTLKIISRNGENKVFSHITQIKEQEFINLTWEVFSSAPSYTTPGVSHVSPTSYRIETKEENSLGTLNTAGGTLYFNSDLTNEYINYARNNGYGVWAMYKTDFNTATASLFLNSNEAREKSADILTEQILKFKLDGINFDFENMYKSDRGAYTNHVREISLICHTLGATVSVDITKYEPTSSTWSMCYNRDSLAKYSDYIMLMAYDQYYAGGKTPGPVSGLGWAEDCIKITLNEVPNDKLVLAMPYYIRIWETKNGKVLSSKAVSMNEAKIQIAENNAAGEYDSKFLLMKYTWEKKSKTYMLWLEDTNSIKTRVSLAKKYNLAGVASWRRGFESEDIWLAIQEEINK